MRRLCCVALLAALATGTGCERRQPDAADTGGPQLTLTVEPPESLDWGRSGILRVTLANEGDVAAEGGIVEVYVPDWLEFGTVEPPGTAVTVTSGEQETRLAYQLTDSLPPGARHTVSQHLRVQYQPASAAQPADTIETVQIPPVNQVVRARLLTVAGEPAGVEVQTTLHFARGPERTLPPVPDTLPRTNDTTGTRSPAAGDTLARPDTTARQPLQDGQVP